MPDGHLRFDERGVAQDGILEHDGVELDMRSRELVAILVSRAAVAPNARADDDEAVRTALMRALRMTRLARWVAIAAPTIWAVLLIAGIANVATGSATDAGDVIISIGGPLLLFATYAALWWFDRRKLRNLEGP